MFVGRRLQPGEQVLVSKLLSDAGTSSDAVGDLHVTNVSLSADISAEHGPATLFARERSDGPRLALARLDAASPASTLALRLDWRADGFALEAAGAALDLVCFAVERLENDTPASGSRRRAGGEKRPAVAAAETAKAPSPAAAAGSAALAPTAAKTNPAKAAAAAVAAVTTPPKSAKDAQANGKAAASAAAPVAATPAKDAKANGKAAAAVAAPVAATPAKDVKANGKATTPSDAAPAKPAAAAAAEAKKSEVPAFVASKKFTGARKGMVFKKGPQGLGYYKDTPPVVATSNNKRKPDAAPAGAREPEQKKRKLPGGVMLEQLKPGNPNAPKASRGRTVQVRYDGRLASTGRRFDKGIIRFKLGAGEVIKGWDVGVEGMCVGERRRLLIPPALGYGSRGAPPDIPPNAALVFEVELVKS